VLVVLCAGFLDRRLLQTHQETLSVSAL